MLVLCTYAMTVELLFLLDITQMLCMNPGM